MSQVLDVNIVRAIAEIAVFLEFSPDRVINPDAAVEVMEQLSATLQLMDASTKLAFSACLPSVASQYRGEQAELVSSLADVLGLV
ncbi:hypothetical protein [Stenotrophomonas sp.]|uniref:hypothetical protein n=1 Tax=Stenotrophomonas sp. TaxID=69392 RepID=UPI0029A0D5A0|nr:hypothetical protein [Stenotrophomonas sp.]MDX3934529.1 hypothetical protein [Stenotrophomonas sp.]